MRLARRVTRPALLGLVTQSVKLFVGRFSALIDCLLQQLVGSSRLISPLKRAHQWLVRSEPSRKRLV